jgi:hypothetical protein
LVDIGRESSVGFATLLAGKQTLAFRPAPVIAAGPKQRLKWGETSALAVTIEAQGSRMTLGLAVD